VLPVRRASGGSARVHSGITLHVADNITLNFSLVVGTVAESVSVIGEAPVVDTTTSTLGGVVDKRQVADLPLNGRNFADLSILELGVQRAWNLGTNNGDITSTIYSSHGQPIRSNTFMMDGALMMNFHGFSAASVGADELGVDGIKEFKVISNNFGPEYGVLIGSQVAITSKGGTNQWHGDVYDYLRNAALDARDFFDVSHLIWFGNYYGHALVKKDPKTAAVKQYRSPAPNATPYGGVVEDTTGYIYFADVNGNHVTRFDPKTEKFVEYPLPTLESYCRFLGVDSKGKVWYAAGGPFAGKVGVIDPKGAR